MFVTRPAHCSLWAINRVASSCSPGDYCVNRSAAVFGVAVSGMKVSWSRGTDSFPSSVRQITSEDTEVVRELIIKGLCVYLHEDPAHLFMEYESEDHAAIQDGIGDTTVGIFLIRQNGAVVSAQTRSPTEPLNNVSFTDSRCYQDITTTSIKLVRRTLLKLLSVKRLSDAHFSQMCPQISFDSRQNRIHTDSVSHYRAESHILCVCPSFCLLLLVKSGVCQPSGFLQSVMNNRHQSKLESLQVPHFPIMLLILHLQVLPGKKTFGEKSQHTASTLTTPPPRSSAIVLSDGSLITHTCQ
ncbi:hypothetical protein JOB18_033219 [Solea senegalensis]|uniref:Uncharacterized protein n=1 Tax=Solea senegalensis TaxID=28829 RepID=A0AAV6T955_SOLSE|nr:hypothetical protein JOB18_033219 [Solea senegalensis]